MTPQKPTAGDPESWASLKKAIEDMMAAMGKALTPVQNAVAAASMRIHEALKRRYEAAGAPYGSGVEAMWRWVREEQDLRNAVDKYREIVSWRKALINLREAIQAKGTGRP